MPKKKQVEELDADALDALLKKEFGEGAVRRASDPSLRITRIPCGLLSVDSVMGGGFPRNRHTEIYGNFGVGKTALTYYLIAYAQELGLTCSFYDAEHGFDPTFAENLGVDLDNLHLPEFDTGNRMINLMETRLRAQKSDVMVVDSIASLTTLGELGKSMEETSMGTEQARLMSAGLRRVTSANRSTAIVFINQLRENVGVTFGKRLTPTGGRAMGFYAGVRLELTRTENITVTRKMIDPSTGKEKDQKVTRGHRVLVRVEKDKTGGATNADTSTFVYDYELGGVDPIEDLMYIGRINGAVCLRGDTWWVEGYEDEKQVGRPKFKKWLRKNRAIAEELKDRLDGYVYGEDEDEDDE